MKKTKQKPKKKKTPQQRIFETIALLPVAIFPVWMFALMYTSGVSGKLFMIALGLSLLLLLVNKLTALFPKIRKLLYITAVISVCAWVVFYQPAVLMMNFSHTRPLYTLKRANYIYSVHSNRAKYYGQLLPEKLPEVCDDYSYRTYGTLLVQDYSPSSNLMFHTDAVTVDSYAEYFDGLEEFTRRENVTGYDEYDGQENAASEFRNELEWFCEQMRLRDSFQDDLDHAVIYRTLGSFPKVVLLNRETGLVAIMT